MIQHGEKGPYKILSSRKIYENPWIRLCEDRVIRPDGGEGVFGLIQMRPGSTVLALDERNEAYLVKEFKYGIGRDSLELMSGGLEENELPLDAAKRELKEELGLKADEWIDLGRVDPFTTVVHSPNYMFLALSVREGESNPEPGESLEVIRVPFSDVVDMVIKSEITHSASCVLIFKADNYLRKRNLL